MTRLFARDLRTSDGIHVAVGHSVRHMAHDWIGVVTEISVPMKGAGAVLLKVRPETATDLEIALKKSTTWPLSDGGTWLVPRDSGCPISQWEIL